MCSSLTSVVPTSGRNCNFCRPPHADVVRPKREPYKDLGTSTPNAIRVSSFSFFKVCALISFPSVVFLHTNFLQLWRVADGRYHPRGPRADNNRYRLCPVACSSINCPTYRGSDPLCLYFLNPSSLKLSPWRPRPQISSHTLSSIYLSN